MDEWDIDICVTASQKGLEAPPGLTPIAVRERAWKLIDSRVSGSPGWYLNLRTWREAALSMKDWQPFPITMAVNTMYALQRALGRILEEGLPERSRRHKEVSRILRRGLEYMGLQPLGDDSCASPTVTAVYLPTVTVGEKSGASDCGCVTLRPMEVVGFLDRKYGIRIAGGLGALKEKVIRIGHMGPSANLRCITPVLFGLEDYLRCKGFEVGLGDSLKAIPGGASYFSGK
jgi:alanine-glyoxylate transaminase/serine-glyoxylate transaminase/serine-pyruvate transaminase